MSALDPTQALGALPQGLRDELMAEYRKITKNFARGEWGDASVHGGRFCEVVYSILRGKVDGGYPASASKPSNFPKACRDLEQVDKAAAPQSVRVGIPRVLTGLYEIRNNRDSGHVGGEVDANHMDASYVLHAVQWVMAELVRLFHATDTSTATVVVTALTDRTLPVIWQVGGKRRILVPSLPLADKVLLLLYGQAGGRAAKDVAQDLKQPRFDNFKRVLKRLDDEVKVEYNVESGLVEISPIGEKDVEVRLLPSLALD
ncbi:hypothetical protein ABTZ46_19205 [Nocardioides sp. NPDC126508]